MADEDVGARSDDQDERLQAFGRALARRLTRQGITRSEMARRLDVHQTAVSYWVTGQREPAPATVFKIEQAVHAPPGALSKFLGYVPAPKRARPDPPPPSIVDAVMANDRLSPDAKDRIISLTRWLLEYEDRDLQHLTDVEEKIRSAKHYIETTMSAGSEGDQRTLELIAAAEESLASIKMARNRAAHGLPVEEPSASE